ncbi:MAG TPA: cupin domain-containing protein, partial [Gaiellaceae bacterium]|nr:cupin domain-containing protein [Gaiellaceae bacterium]
GYRVVLGDKHEWTERPAREGQRLPRQVADVTTAADLQESRARLWRLPGGTRGVRHIERAQEEVFVVLEGTLTILLGDPPERFDLPPKSVASVAPGTAIQMRNEGDAEVVVFAYGAPPVAGEAEYLDDVEL